MINTKLKVHYHRNEILNSGKQSSYHCYITHFPHKWYILINKNIALMRSNLDFTIVTQNVLRNKGGGKTEPGCKQQDNI